MKLVYSKLDFLYRSLFEKKTRNKKGTLCLNKTDIFLVFFTNPDWTLGRDFSVFDYFRF